MCVSKANPDLKQSHPYPLNERFPPLPAAAAQAIYLDKRSWQDHRRRQTRAPSVRFDPLEHHDQQREDQDVEAEFRDRRIAEGAIEISERDDRDISMGHCTSKISM